jgi:hypothetical protein
VENRVARIRFSKTLRRRLRLRSVGRFHSPGTSNELVSLSLRDMPIDESNGKLISMSIVMSVSRSAVKLTKPLGSSVWTETERVVQRA